MIGKGIIFKFSSYPNLISVISKKQQWKIDIQNEVEPLIPVFEKLGFSENMLLSIFHQRQRSLTIDKNHLNVKDLHELFQNRFNNIDAKQFRTILFKDPLILGKTLSEIENNLNTMQETMKIKNDDVLSILVDYPLLMRNFTKFQPIYAQYFQQYVQATNEQHGKYLVSTPYLYAFEQERIPKNFRYLYYWGFQKKQINELLLKNAEFLDWKPIALEQLLMHYKVLIPDLSILSDLIVNNHKLLQLHAPFMVAKKINILKELGFSIKQVGKILQNQPNFFIKSVSSLKLKLNFFEKYFKIQIQKDPNFAELMTFDYWKVIRPRLVITNNVENAVEVCKLTEEEFISKYNCQEQYNKLLSDIPSDLKKEVDFYVRKYHRFCHNKIELLQ